MEFRVLDEIVEISNKGLMLFSETEDSNKLYNGCKICDSRGNVHIVDTVSCQDMLTTLFIRGSHTDYFNRLFRDIQIDATLFSLCEDGEEM